MTSNPKLALRQFMKEEDMDTFAVARAISALTFREYSVRTVQAWLANENKTSHRDCPGWVVDLLQKNRAQLKGEKSDQTP